MATTYKELVKVWDTMEEGRRIRIAVGGSGARVRGNPGGILAKPNVMYVASLRKNLGNVAVVKIHPKAKAGAGLKATASLRLGIPRQSRAVLAVGRP
jgi:hypothetical protein